MDNRILIDAKQLEKQLGAAEWIVIDCRFSLADPTLGRRNYEEGHIPGAIFLDLDEDLSGPVRPDSGRHPLPDVHAIVDKLESSGVGDSNRIVVYDDSHGAIAARTWWILRWLGHKSVYLLDGGLSHWLSAGFPVVDEVMSRPRATFRAHPRKELLVTTDDLASSGDIESFNLLDARDATRFRGEHEPIDAVAGHIPGSKNLPFTEFVRPDGSWLPLAEREALLVERLESRESAWCVMCGSGVTACHLAISGLEAGLPEPRLYVGSWSEWIRDPGRPIGSGQG